MCRYVYRLTCVVVCPQVRSVKGGRCTCGRAWCNPNGSDPSSVHHPPGPVYTSKGSCTWRASSQPFSLSLSLVCSRCLLATFVPYARRKNSYVWPRIDAQHTPYSRFNALSDDATTRFPNVSTKGRGYQIRAMTEGPEGWEELRKVSVWQTTAALQQEMEAKMIKARQQYKNSGLEKLTGTAFSFYQRKRTL